jgi:hypothetical protein
MLLPLLTVAITWGVTNPLIKRGSAGLERLKSRAEYKRAKGLQKVWLDLKYLATEWRYLIPLFINLSGSVLFFASLGSVSNFTFSWFLMMEELALIGPLTNSLTLVIGTLTGYCLGEPLPSQSHHLISNEIFICRGDIGNRLDTYRGCHLHFFH